jgi:hypothetical protein
VIITFGMTRVNWTLEGNTKGILMYMVKDQNIFVHTHNIFNRCKTSHLSYIGYTFVTAQERPAICPPV